VSYHRFANLGEMFQGELSRKLTVGLTSQDFEHPWHPATAELDGLAPVATTTCGGIKSSLKNSMQQHGKSTHGKHTTQVQS